MGKINDENGERIMVKSVVKTKHNRMVRFFVALTLVLVMMANSLSFSIASGTAPIGVEITDMYSTWAAWDIMVAESIYQLGNEGTYSNYRGAFTSAKFIPVLESIATVFNLGANAEIANTGSVTRGEVVGALFSMISEALALDGVVSDIDYFIEKGLIKGRALDDYQLERICTTEEMITFSVRVYDHISYALGSYTSGLFWRITGENSPNTVYLFGTVHLGDSTIYPLSSAIIEAFDSSSYLAVEANVLTISEDDIAYINQIQLLTDGSTIKDHVSEETYELYAAAAESYGIPQQLYDYIKPWSAFISMTQVMMTGGEESAISSALLGMDMYLLTKALYFGKSIIEVESIRYQMDLFDSFSQELQELLLLQLVTPFHDDDVEVDDESSIDISESTRAVMAYLIDAVKNGDEDALTMLMLSSRDYTSPLMSEYNNKIWDIRDANMAEKIEEFLALQDSEGDFFVAVGAGHTVGETGIASVLAEKGYSVERVW